MKLTGSDMKIIEEHRSRWMECKQKGCRVELASCLVADIILCNAFTAHSHLGEIGSYSLSPFAGLLSDFCTTRIV